eukprot:CAMPEP_0179967310 /NCGR_PEP_ID=MMETSP0983-20121128/33087_1 /TAXON_ID=483367 /ORGANISM="non described non described, Strain CCMP 2436" /LENGTH=100 /DNA_ID=CAMNT_0021880681 /DNA_START=946 /DNA_END=1245 /DNA_ORIENTATION=+
MSVRPQPAQTHVRRQAAAAKHVRIAARERFPPCPAVALKAVNHDPQAEQCRKQLGAEVPAGAGPRGQARLLPPNWTRSCDGDAACWKGARSPPHVQLGFL